MLQAEEPVSRTPANAPLAADPSGEGRCENCGATGQNTRQSWCRRCGYYAVLRRCVDLDHEWEDAVDPASEQNQSADDRPSLIVAFKAIPRWVWPALGAMVLAIVATLAGRLATPPQSMLRVQWAFFHLAASVAAFLCGQGWACFRAAAADPQFGLLDAVLRPFAIWKPALDDMPRARRPLSFSVGGLTAAVAVLTIGGFPYDYIFEEEIFKARPERKLAQAIAIQQERMDRKKLEDELLALADQQKDEQKKEIERPLAQDCVIIGYVPSGSAETGFSSILVAAPVGEDQALHFVATVSEGLSPAVRAELLPKLQAGERNGPFVPCSVPGALWVEPTLTCRIRFAEWTNDWFLKEPSLDALLQKVK